LIFEDWGLIDYSFALQKQLEYVEFVSSNESHPGFVIFCSHPATVTIGRQTQADDITSWNGPVIEVSRGGRATYHGPSQLVVYPIISLKNARKSRGPQEIRGFIKALEKAIVLALANYDVQSKGKTSDSGEDTGVWINTPNGEKKVASLGIAIKKWVTYHGAAINILDDSSAFTGINPCGFSSDIMISIEKILSRKIDIDEFKKTLLRYLENLI
jgi:lipoyl(octanoyl) transferase